MKRILLLSLWIFFFQSLFADIPPGYYDGAEGLNGGALKQKLHDIVTEGHTKLSYTPGVWDAYETTDVLPSPNEKTIWDMYSDVPGGSSSYTYELFGDQCGSYSVEGDCYNREHSFPKSWWGGFDNTSNPQYSDLNHLFATDGKVNGMRDNYPFGEVDDIDYSWKSTNGSKLGSCIYPGYKGTVFEPINEYKGDFARAYFYMATRYKDEIPTWVSLYGGSYDIDEVFETGGEFKTWYLNMIIEWSINDPVSQKEIDRNNAVYAIQHNRNPFIDHPEYVAQIWGGEGVFISSVSSSPDSPTSSDIVTVNANITSSGGNITTANLEWGTASGLYLNTVEMTASKGSYSANIPAQTNGTIVYYIIQADDDNDETSISSEYNYTINDNPAVVLLDEDFATCPASGWTMYSVSGNENWECGTGFMQINAYGSDVACDDWLISPEIDLNSTETEKFSFKSWNKYTDSYYPPIKVKYSIDYSGSGDPSFATWNDLVATWSSENSQTWTESGEIDLSSIIGSKVYIVFQYTSSGTGSGSSAYWEIDDILITGTASTPGVPQITNITNMPESPTAEDNVTISATIIDDGTISLAEIKWGTTAGDYPNTVTMTNMGDVYSGTILPQVEGTTVYYVIEATDNVSLTNRSDENSYTVALNQLPEITNISNSPLAPFEGDDVTVSATITDPDGTISSAEIKWGTTNGTFDNTISMIYTGSDNIYNGIIPSQAGGVYINYVIEAFDNDLDTNRSDEYHFSFNTVGNEVPVITNMSIDPTNPESENVVSVSATITDSDGTVSSAFVKWGTTTGTYPGLVVMSKSGDVFTADIPAQADETHVYFIIYALDEDGGSALSTEQDYLVEDVNLLPEISNVVFEPADPESTEKVSVSANISDTDGTINTAILKWGTSTGNYSYEVNMVLSSGNTYVADVPAQSEGTTVYFVLEATDNEAGMTISNEYSYTVEDQINLVPVISNVKINPLNPTENDNVIISATATDADGEVVSVGLKWKYGETGTDTFSSMNKTLEVWYGAIPKQSIGETIYYTIIAKDDKNAEGTSDGNYEISNSNGIEDAQTSRMELYPNPTQGIVHIEFTDAQLISSIYVYNLIGEKVMEIRSLNTSDFSLDLSLFPKGIYILKINDTDQSIVRKILLK